MTKIIPSARVKQIQPLEKAVVKRILVREEDYVREGQPLIELDSAATLADEKRLNGELQSAQLNTAVRETLALLNGAVEIQDELIFKTLSLSIVSHATEKERLLHTRDYQCRVLQLCGNDIFNETYLEPATAALSPRPKR